MSASPFMIDAPSPPLASPSSFTQSPQSAQSRSSTEAFPTFKASPPLDQQRYSQTSHKRTQSNSLLEVPNSAVAPPQRPNRLFRAPSQRLPPNLLLPSSRNGSHIDISSPVADRERDRNEPVQQRLPQAAPAPSLSGAVPPTASVSAGFMRNSNANVNPLNRRNPGQSTTNAEELRSESLWADMQRTLADVELSAMSSSHLFNVPHSQALEELRETQLALARAWARSEADETHGQESEDDYLDSEPKGNMQAGTLAIRSGGVEGKAPIGKATMPGTTSTGAAAKDNTNGPGTKSRSGSATSNVGADLEAETERDIKLARRRREANDLYFSQVNKGVLDVVARLDEVAAAMRKVENESRAVWNEMGGTSGGGSATASASELEADGSPADAQRQTQPHGGTLLRELTRVTTDTTTTGTGAATGSGSGTELSDSPATQRKPVFGKRNERIDSQAEKDRSR